MPWRKAGDANLRAQHRLGPRFAVAALLVPMGAASFTAGLGTLAIPLLLFSRGVALGPAAGLYALLALTGVWGSLAAGRHAARLSRPLPLLGALAVAAAAFPCYLLVRGPASLLAVGAVASLAGALAGPPLQHLIASATDGASRTAAFARFGLVVSVSHGASLCAASFLFRHGFTAVFLLGGAVSLAGLFLAAALLWRRRLRSPAARRLAAAAAALEDRLRALGRAIPGPRRDAWTPSLRNGAWMAAHTALLALALSAYPLFMPLFLLQMDLPLAWIGWIVAGSWFAFAAAQPAGAWLVRRIGHRAEIVTWSLFAAAGLNFTLALSPLWGVVASWLALGVVDGVGRPLTQSWLADSVLRPDWGRVMGWTLAATTAARIVAPLLMAALAAAHGLPMLFLAAGLLVMLSLWPLERLGAGASQDAPAAPTSRAPAGGEA